MDGGDIGIGKDRSLIKEGNQLLLKLQPERSPNPWTMSLL